MTTTPDIEAVLKLLMRASGNPDNSWSGRNAALAGHTTITDLQARVIEAENQRDGSIILAEGFRAQLTASQAEVARVTKIMDTCAAESATCWANLVKAGSQRDALRADLAAHKDALQVLRDLPIVENDNPNTLHLDGQAYTGPVVDYLFKIVRKVKDVAARALAEPAKQVEPTIEDRSMVQGGTVKDSLTVAKQPEGDALDPDAWRKFELWLFRECNHGTRRHLWAIFGLPVDEITNHGTERHALRFVRKALAARGLSVGEAE